MRNYFIFDEFNTKSAHLNIEKKPSRTAPLKRKTVYQVAGRSGDIPDYDGASENIELKYSVSCSKIDENFSLIEEFAKKTGYKKLSDSYSSDGFYYAFLHNQVSFQEDLLNVGRAEIIFSAEPYFYLNSGETEITVPPGSSQQVTINNPTETEALPLITVRGSGGSSVNIYINSDHFNLKIPAGKNSVVIDSKNQQFYSGSTNELKYYYPDDFPVLMPGANTVSVLGASSIIIKPRWRK